MPKQVMLRDDVLKKLDEIREEKRCSYSDAIDFLLSHKPEEMWIPEVNKRFFELEGIFPDMKGIFEVMRVIAIHFQRLPVEAKGDYIEEVGRKLEDVLALVVKIKEMKENGKKNSI